MAGIELVQVFQEYFEEHEKVESQNLRSQKPKESSGSSPRHTDEKTESRKKSKLDFPKSNIQLVSELEQNLGYLTLKSSVLILYNQI